MRDKHYKTKGYRISDEVKTDLEKLKAKTGMSYNLLFKELIKHYGQH